MSQNRIHAIRNAHTLALLSSPDEPSSSSNHPERRVVWIAGVQESAAGFALVSCWSYVAYTCHSVRLLPERELESVEAGAAAVAAEEAQADARVTVEERRVA